MEMAAAVENIDKVLETDIMIDDGFDSFSTLNIDIKPEADEIFDPNNFDWHSDVVSDESDEVFKPPESGKKRKTSSKRNAKLRSSTKGCSVSTKTGFHICHICQAKFINKCSLTRHLKWHSKQSEYLDCTKYARDITATSKCKESDFINIVNHQLTNNCTSHPSSTDEPCSCTQCDYRSVWSGDLQRHMKTHTGEILYACTQCDYRSAHSDSLQTHIKTHTREKPYACLHIGVIYRNM
ncbi:gastrula zinc finger protein XlCGF8.2DB-like [Watersipora subatra]|uniref:gastrula zinc finger protein XlCGF8.2DB-like n=1 Tax=Watersipora subatra TaxID=2589382 RepID=UPI00355C91D8